MSDFFITERDTRQAEIDPYFLPPPDYSGLHHHAPQIGLAAILIVLVLLVPFVVRWIRERRGWITITIGWGSAPPRESGDKTP